uniref:Putative secreted peptide n=1 Tax=Anopheles braziliensis TaxID=58242 RepID=A0A2M3ZMF9_9DIPT
MFFSPRSFLMFSCTSLSVSPFSKLTNAVLVRGPDSLASDDPIVPISPGCVLIRYVLLPLGQTTQPSYHISPLSGLAHSLFLVTSATWSCFCFRFSVLFRQGIEERKEE